MTNINSNTIYTCCLLPADWKQQKTELKLRDGSGTDGSYCCSALLDFSVQHPTARTSTFRASDTPF